MSLHRRRSNILLALFTILSFSMAVQALPLSSQPSDTHYKNEHPNWGCSFSGNSNLYGLGIRVGVYLQLLSILLANALLSKELREDARNTNAIIMIAIFAGMVNATIKTQMNAIEIFVMSTLLMSFLWSDFTPSHISSLVLFNHSKEKTAHKRTITKQTVSSLSISSSSSNQASQQGVAATEVENKPYFAAISRSVFGTAIAIFNVWFWLYSRHTLLKNGIDNPVCIPIVFLQTQIALDTNQALFYVIVSIIYAAYEVLFMGWWLYVLAPGTLRLFWELSVIAMASIFHCKCEKADISVQAKVAKWYLEFARLDQGALRSSRG
jgi:hypothetical protein